MKTTIYYKDNHSYNVPDNMPEWLRTLMLNTESLTPEERQYFFTEYNNMTTEESDRLTSILEEEKNKLELLDKKYQDEIDKLNSFYLTV